MRDPRQPIPKRVGSSAVKTISSIDRIGWKPEDSAEDYRAEVGHIVSDDPVEERYQGGSYTSDGYTRKGGFSPRDQFDLD